MLSCVGVRRVWDRKERYVPTRAGSGTLDPGTGLSYEEAVLSVWGPSAVPTSCCGVQSPEAGLPSPPAAGAAPSRISEHTGEAGEVFPKSCGDAKEGSGLPSCPLGYQGAETKSDSQEARIAFFGGTPVATGWVFAQYQSRPRPKSRPVSVVELSTHSLWHETLTELSDLLPVGGRHMGQLVVSAESVVLVRAKLVEWENLHFLHPAEAGDDSG